ncbi:sulfur carrier protein ThiS [Rheinheimera sp.]|uniref:sulfur carrier protein ThiS n=1 Tax=Rheinheimera sp. TaxID=1869214 RepID=UPI0039C9552D
MLITVNDSPLQLETACSVEQLITQLKLDPNGLAVAINNNVLLKRLWPEHLLKPADSVQLFQLVTGG